MAPAVDKTDGPTRKVAVLTSGGDSAWARANDDADRTGAGMNAAVRAVVRMGIKRCVEEHRRHD